MVKDIKTERKTKIKNEQSGKGNDFRLLMDTSESDASSDIPKHKQRSKSLSSKMPERVSFGGSDQLRRLSLPFTSAFSGPSKSSGEVLREMLDSEQPRKCYKGNNQSTIISAK